MPTGLRTATPAERVEYQHRPVKVEYPKRTVFLCERCLVLWPCLEAQRKVLARV